MENTGNTTTVFREKRDKLFYDNLYVFVGILNKLETREIRTTRPRRPGYRREALTLGERKMKPKEIIVNDRMQQGYCYLLTQPAGRGFHPDFCPGLTPKQMLELGVFGGKYMTDCRDEFPASWFDKAKLSPGHANPELNYFRVSASKPLSYWIEKGWIRPQDPRGWFQWYCRYYLGRRSEDDVRQIKRWKAMQRHVSQLQKHCRKGDLSCRPVQRQAMLHWAYDSRKM